MAGDHWNQNEAGEVLLNINGICGEEVLFSGAADFIRLLMGSASGCDYGQGSAQDMLSFTRKLKISPNVVMYLLQRVRWFRIGGWRRFFRFRHINFTEPTEAYSGGRQ